MERSRDRIVAWNRLIVAQRVPNDGHSVCARLATWHAKITLLLPGTEGPFSLRNDWHVIGPRNSRRPRWSCPSTGWVETTKLIRPTKRTFTRLLHKRLLTPSTGFLLLLFDRPLFPSTLSLCTLKRIVTGIRFIGVRFLDDFLFSFFFFSGILKIRGFENFFSNFQ